MSSLSLATVTRVWAQSLADLDPVPEDKLQILQQVCKADAISDRPTKTSGGMGKPACSRSGEEQLSLLLE